MRNRDKPATGIPAIAQQGQYAVGAAGLSKREAAAIAAMQANRIGRPEISGSVLALSAVLDADALFDELEKGDG